MSDRSINTASIKRPSDIENTSMAIIEEELKAQGIVLPEEYAPVIKRVIHTTADFEFVDNLIFLNDPISKAKEYLLSREGEAGENPLSQGGEAGEKTAIVTDTTMALSGIAKVALERLGAQTHCYVSEPEVTDEAKRLETTKAYASMRYALQRHPKAIYAVGNGPTALYSLAEQIEEGARPTLIIAVPVGFVNVVEAKEVIADVCERTGVPLIAAMGRKGGSTVATAIVNAILYEACDMTDPKMRGWV